MKSLKWIVLTLLGYSWTIVSAQTYINQPLTGPVPPGDYYSDHAIVLSPGVILSPTGNDSYNFHINSAGVPGSCTTLTSSFNQNKNYLVTTTVKIPGISNASELAGKGTCEIMEDIQYFDGLGRPMQTIAIKGSPGLNDIVGTASYDILGRQPSQYLPYTINNNNGAYIADALSAGVAGFYNSPPTGVTQNQYPLSQSLYDGSPLNRVIEQSAPGSLWQLGNNHTTKQDFAHNDGILFNPNNVSGCKRVALYNAVTANGLSTLNRADGTAVYSDDQLYVIINKNANWVGGCLETVEKYTDKEGKTILTRSYNKNSAGQTEMFSTYYVYDQFGNLCFIIPPKADADNDNAITQDVIDNLCYQYRYDTYRRVIARKIPGKGWDFLVYNKLNQAVMSQDANQRNKTPQQWVFTKYDAQGRNVIMGIYNDPNTLANGIISNPDDSRRVALQQAVNQQSDLWENRDNNGPQGYSNKTLPAVQDIANYLSVNYFDNYDIPGLPALYNKQNDFSKSIDGMPTASKIAVLNNPAQLLWTVGYYDDNHNTVKVFLQHYKGSLLSDNNYDELTNTYGFSGEILSGIRTHFVGGIEKAKIYNQYDYDHMGRLLNTKEKINNDPMIILSSNEYNELGQLKSKKLHSENNGSNFLQTVNYSYNERGWMHNALSDLFKIQLDYDSPAAATPQYTGMISSVRWGSSLDKIFNYEYDPQNRLTQGISQVAGMSETGIRYDKAGNINSLTRDGSTISYNYLTNGGIAGNQLASVNGTGLQNQTYIYDKNGNVIIDGSKTNVNIGYNLLNLTESVSGSQNITYSYDATGAMLSKNSSATGLTEYVNGIQYGNNSNGYDIDFINTAEGRAVRQSDNTYRYQYDLTDHLGNTRLTFDKDPTTGTARRLQEDDYYPFGVRKSVSPISQDNLYLFTGKELQPELNQYDYGARFYDPVIARWNVIDGLADNYSPVSPYNFTVNNPVNFIDPDGMQAFDWGLPPGETDKTKGSWFSGSVPKGWTNLGSAGWAIDEASGMGILYNSDGTKSYSSFPLNEVKIKSTPLKSDLTLSLEESSKVYANSHPGFVSPDIFARQAVISPNLNPVASAEERGYRDFMQQQYLQSKNVNYQDFGSRNTSLAIGINVVNYYGAISGVAEVTSAVSAWSATKELAKIEDIHFMQSSIKNATGEYTVLENAAALKAGTLDPEVLKINVWKDATGKIWSLDNRRLAAFKLSSLEKAPVNWVNPAGQMWKMTTKTEGVSTVLKIGDGTKMIVK